MGQPGRGEAEAAGYDRRHQADPVRPASGTWAPRGLPGAVSGTDRARVVVKAGETTVLRLAFQNKRGSANRSR